MNQDLQIIKKKYGEEMMHFCRKSFPTILETKGVLSKLLLEHFEPSTSLWKDILENDLTQPFISFIEGLVSFSPFLFPTSTKTIEELFLEAGYTFYECKSEEEIQKFKSYYAKGEELCTFFSNRLLSHFVFFAVKQGADLLNREDFLYPLREDEYGKSVISIQFTKAYPNRLSIKNRYNHHVENGDATFANNLENITPGLTDAFHRTYGFHVKSQKSSFYIPNYVVLSDGKYYKYNYHINGIYYCPNNIIIDHEKVIRLPKEKYLLMDYFILENQNNNKSLQLYDASLKDSFPAIFSSIQKIQITHFEEGKKVTIFLKNAPITIYLDCENRIKKIIMNFVLELSDFFLTHQTHLEEISCFSLQKVGNSCFYKNQNLKAICFPNVEVIGNDFLFFNKALKQIDAPKLKILGNGFRASFLEVFYAPMLEQIGHFVYLNEKRLQNFYAPSLLFVGKRFRSDGAFLPLKIHYIISRNRMIKELKERTKNYLARKNML